MDKGSLANFTSKKEISSGAGLIFQLLLLLVLCGSDIKAQQPYFQQKTDYKIQVVLDDINNTLKGNVSIQYTNNSNDTLHLIWFHLWPNAYRDRNTALNNQLIENGITSLYFADKKNKGFIDSLNFSVDEQKVTMQYDSVHSDICKIILKKPLLPGNTVEIKTPFYVKLPSASISRLGFTGDAFYISQWYPKPAVYDRNGWHAMPYLTQGEFYSEFGNFEVTITLPENYVVAATGVLQEEKEILRLKEIAQNTLLKTEFDLPADSFPQSSTVFKTITFHQDSIHDFAWFADKRFNVLMDEVTLPETGKKVKTAVYFTDKRASRWKKAIEYMNKGLLFLSEEVGEYAYSSFSVVDGTIAAGGGMEYPMITIINTPSDEKTFEHTVFHELCHNWFYGIIANNERTFGWMDEGLTTYYELKYAEKFLNGKLPGNNGLSASTGLIGRLTGLNEMNELDFQNITYKISAFNNSDQPVNTLSTDFTYLNYATVMYTKTSLLLNFLNDYLGDEMFRKCMKEYFSVWKFRHPDPDDIKQSFETTSNVDLSWLFNDLLATTKPVRLKVQKSEDSVLQLKNHSAIPVPVKIENEFGNSIWVNGFKDTASVIFPFTTGKYIFLNSDYSTLFKSSDRPFRRSSAKQKLPSLKLRPFYRAIDEPATETLYLMPVVAWNNYDNWMAGIHLSNMDLIPEPFEFYAVPLYDFTNKTITGLAGADYSLWPISGAFSEVKIGVRGKRFAYAHNTSTDKIFADQYPVFFYSKLAPGISVALRKKNPRSSVSHSFGYRNISVWLDEVKYTQMDTIYLKNYTTTLLNFNELTWQLNNTRIIDPYSIGIRGEQGNEHIKLSMELNYRFSYNKHNKGIEIRLFAGGFLLNKTTDRNYNFRMAGWDGSQDYLYDETFFGRSEDDGLWSKQFLVRDGGFKIPTFVGQTNQWLVAMNVEIDIPAPLPVKFFIDLGTYEGISTTFEGITSVLMFDGGIAITPIRDVFEIYIPFFKSKDIERSFETNNVKFADQIRFVFNLNKLTPLSLRNRTIQNFQ